jgi:sugar lactone lactonase YvrE
MDVEVVTRAADTLGEGPVWIGASRQLLRVDIHAPALVLRDGAGERRRRVTQHVGFALPTAAGGIVAGVGRTLQRFADLEAEPEPLATVEPDRPGNRFNDAAIDARGRLWAGTMSVAREPGTAALYRIEPDRPPNAVISGATISNGLDWSLDATRLYYIDSPTQRIDAIDFDLDRGSLGRRRPFVAIEPADGLPDGLCVDAEGGIWVALFGGGALRRFLPSGALDAHVTLPVAHPTSLAFGGPDLRELFVTSARRTEDPLAGSLLRLRPGVAGRPTTAFGAG